ncbi:MAG TPA: DNA internalization-related competence protein ComEC/Rec2 [Bryobacteraceae bacterium]|nr:DNA internalization-related competence protein ComEC/Rec2 [Bryobacteraceae bacterium]
MRDPVPTRDSLVRDQAAGDPLVLPLVAITAGILLSRAAPFTVAEAAWVAGAFCALWALSVRRGGRWLSRMCASLALISTGALTEAWHRPGNPPEIDAGSREIVLLDGCVVEPSVFSPNREQFTLELAPGARARVSLFAEDRAPDDDAALQPAQTLQTPPNLQALHYGQRVEIEARIRPPRNFRNPGAFDYAGYLAVQKIFWTATMTRGTSPKILEGHCGSRTWSAIFALREAALARLDRLYAGNEYATGMMEAVLLGETSKLERIWTENFRRTGTFHALVISGAHVAVLAGVLLFFLRLCALPEIPALALTAAAAWLYALVTGFSPPVGRAAGGFTLYLAARFFFRRGRVINLLAAVAIAYFLAAPLELFDASFQLSFLSVAAIGAVAAPVLKATSGPYLSGLRGISRVGGDPHLEPRVAQLRVEIRLVAETVELLTRLNVRWVAAAIAALSRGCLFTWELAVVSTVIQIGLALPMAEYFHRVSFTGLSANLIVVPLLSAVVPLGFLAIFTGSGWIAVFAGWLLGLAARTADWHARLEPSWRIASPPWWLVWGFAIALIALALLVNRRIGRCVAATAVLGFFAILLWQPWPPDVVRGTLEMTAIDVGQGDSLLVAFPDGKIMLVDGGGVLSYGPRIRRTNLDIGEDVVSPYLWTRGIRRLDVLVVTHAHEDHSGGAVAVIENFRPARIWVGANPAPAILAAAARLHIPVDALHAASAFDFGGAGIKPLSPPEDYANPRPGNNDSLAFRISYGARSFLLTGDMERPMEQRLLAGAGMGHADVLKVGHHGSKTSTTQEFLDATAPQVAVISAGFENSFGHPHRDVVGRLTERHSAILRTDLDGLVTVRTDGTHLWYDQTAWWATKAAPGFEWAISLSP